MSPTPQERTELLGCIPEWCAQENGVHDDTCPEHSFTMTKSAFVAAAEGGAEGAIAAYNIMREEGFEHEQALEQAMAEAEESAVCFVGIGSCGRGWCKHG